MPSVQECVNAARQGKKGKAILAFFKIWWSKGGGVDVNFPADLPTLLAKYAVGIGRVFTTTHAAATSSATKSLPEGKTVYTPRHTAHQRSVPKKWLAKTERGNSRVSSECRQLDK